MYNNILSSHSFLFLLIFVCQEIYEVTLKPSSMWCKISILNYETVMTVIVFYFNFIASSKCCDQDQNSLYQVTHTLKIIISSPQKA